MPPPLEPTFSPGADSVAVQAHLRRAARSAQAPWLHAEVARRMQQRLDVVLVTPSVVLDWWSSLGASAGLLQARYPRARIEAVEPSDALRQRSMDAARAPWWSAARWRRAAQVAWVEAEAPRDGRAQLVWANMMLHWRADPLSTLTHWSESLAADGFVMFSCFGPDTLATLRALYRRLGWPSPGHAFIDMHDIGDALLQAGFADPVMDMERITLTWADPGSALAELRGLGGNASGARLAGLRTPRWRAQLCREMERSLGAADGRLGLEFEIVYGHAFKARPRVKLAAETRIGVETLRGMARATRSGGAA